MKENHKPIRFVNLSISALSLYDKASFTFFAIVKNLHMYTAQTSFIIRKIMNIDVRTSYYVFCYPYT